METQTQNTISAAYGRDVLNDFNDKVAILIRDLRNLEKRKEYFQAVFKPRLVDHLLGHWKGKKEFGLFWLNLDTDCKTRVLKSIGISLEWPELPGAEEGKKYFNAFTWPDDDRQIRYTGIGFKKFTETEVIPHSLIFIDRFILYANNHGIGYDEAWSKSEALTESFSKYKGNKYGDYTNWLKFWLSQPATIRLEICERLVNYGRS